MAKKYASTDTTIALSGVIVEVLGILVTVNRSLPGGGSSDVRDRIEKVSAKMLDVVKQLESDEE